MKQYIGRSHGEDDIARRVLYGGMICALALIVLLIFSAVFTSAIQDNPVAIGDGWLMTLSGESEEISLPARVDAAPGETILLQTIIEPNTVKLEAGNGVVALRTQAHTLKAFWNGALLYSYGMEDCAYGKSPPPASHIIDLPDTVDGTEEVPNELTLELSSNSRVYIGRLPAVYVGSLQAIRSRIDHNAVPWTLLAGGLLLFGVILCVVYAFLRASFQGQHLLQLGFFVSLYAVWAIMSSRMPQPMLVNYFISYQVGQLAILLMPLPYVLYARVFVAPRHPKTLLVIFYIHAAFALTAIVLQLTGVLDFTELAPIIPPIFLATMAFCGYSALKNRAQRIERSGKLLVTLRTISYFMLYASIIAEYVADMCLPNANIKARFTLVAMMLYAVGMYLEISRLWINTLNVQARTAEQLRESRLQLMIEQMKPHFLYNTLNSINILIETEPEKASRLLYNFSKYLRVNIDSLANARLIPFSQEMEIINVYLEIVRARFGDDIRFFQDIRADGFKVPPLSIQTLVENSVSHGLRKKAGPGEIRILSTEAENGFLVTVTDTGVGFDPSKSAEGVSTGLNNTRFRVKEMCQGSLTVESAPGKGATVAVFIPSLSQNVL